MEADLRFPVGKFQRPTAPLSDGQRHEFIEAIAATPARLNEAVKGLKPEQLDTRYRPEGWTVRQVVHHVPDSHMNAYTRFKLALTEELPLIKPYDEAKWAELGDVRTAPIEPSLALLENLHKRWVLLLRTLGPIGMVAQIPSSGVGQAHVAGRYARVVRLARKTSCGAHHLVA